MRVLLITGHREGGWPWPWNRPLSVEGTWLYLLCAVHRSDGQALGCPGVLPGMGCVASLPILTPAEILSQVSP